MGDREGSRERESCLGSMPHVVREASGRSQRCQVVISDRVTLAALIVVLQGVLAGPWSDIPGSYDDCVTQAEFNASFPGDPSFEDIALQDGNGTCVTESEMNAYYILFDGCISEAEFYDTIDGAQAGDWEVVATSEGDSSCLTESEINKAYVLFDGCITEVEYNAVKQAGFPHFADIASMDADTSCISYAELMAYMNASAATSSTTPAPTTTGQTPPATTPSPVVCPRAQDARTGGCTYCEDGKYKDTAGSHPCMNCPAGKRSWSPGCCSDMRYECRTCDPGDYSEEGASYCRSCPSNSISLSNAAANCTCNSGYTGTGGNCEMCAGILALRASLLLWLSFSLSVSATYSLRWAGGRWQIQGHGRQPTVHELLCGDAESVHKRTLRCMLSGRVLA